jgi:transposase
VLRSYCQGASPNTITWRKSYAEIEVIRNDLEEKAAAYKSELFPQYFPNTKKRKRLTKEQSEEVNAALKARNLVYSCKVHGVDLQPDQGGLTGGDYAYLLETPKDIRAGVIDNFIDAIKSNRTRIQNLWAIKRSRNPKVRIHEWKLHPKKIQPGESYIPLSGSNKGTTYDAEKRTFALFPKMGAVSLTAREHVKAAPRIPDWKLVQQQGQWYACISFDREVCLAAPDPHVRQKIASIDPGVRTMFTVYSPEGTITELGKDMHVRMTTLQRRIHRREQHSRQLTQAVKIYRKIPPGVKISSLTQPERAALHTAPNLVPTSKRPHRKQRDRGLVKRRELHTSRCDDLDKKVCKRFRRKRYRMRRAVKKLRQRLEDFVDGRHHAYSHFLCSNFENILIPRFNVKSMIARKARVDENGKFVKASVLSKQTKLCMIAMKHGKFRTRLIEKSSEYAGSQVWTASEEYTTQTCGACLKLNKHVGSSKVFRCPNPECGLVIDRDWNGSRNLLVKCMNI